MITKIKDMFIPIPITDKIKEEFTHIESKNECYNDYEITFRYMLKDNLFYKRPKVTGEISAFYIDDQNRFLYMSEDDCHYREVAQIYNLVDLYMLKRTLEEVKKQVELNYNWVIAKGAQLEKTKPEGMIVTLAIGNTIIQFHSSWIDSQVELVNRALSIFEKYENDLCEQAEKIALNLEL